MIDHAYEILLTKTFLDKLRKGNPHFTIGLDVYLQALKATDYFFKEHASEGLKVLGEFLAPIVCRSAEQQRDFYIFFEKEVVAAFKTRMTEYEIQGRSGKCGRFCLVIVIVLSVTAVGYFYNNKSHKAELNYSAVSNAGYPFYKKGDKLSTDLKSVFTKISDSIDFHASASRYGRTETVFFDQAFYAGKTGRDTLFIRLWSDKSKLDTLLVNDSIFVAPAVDGFILFDENTLAGVQNTYVLQKRDSLNLPFSWYFDDSSNVLWDNCTTLDYSFNEPGRHTIRVQYQTGADSTLSKFPESFFSISASQQVTANEGLKLELLNKRSLPVIHSHSPNWIWVISWGLVSMASLLLVYFSRRQLTRIRKEKVPELSTELHTLDVTGSQAPYDIPFASADNNILQLTSIDRLARELKRTTESQASRIDFRETIRQTVRNKGFISPVFRRNLTNVYYLFLVDCASANSQQFRLFSFLVNYFKNRSVRIDFYFYYQSPDLFFKKENDKGLTLLQLTDQYYSASLFVISTGQSFLDFNKHEIRQDYKNRFKSWSSRTLITPRPYNDWGSTEQKISELFALVPADIGGLMEIIKMMGEEQKPIHTYRNSFMSYETRTVDFTDFQSLLEYLADEDLLQWVCALAVYPKISWELSLEIGRVVLGPGNTKLNYTSLLKLTRIKWLNEGHFTSAIRLMLLRELSIKNELKARATVMKLLDEIQLDSSAFSYEEKLVNKCTNSFILWATSNENKKFYEDIYKNPIKLEKYARIFMNLYKGEKLMDVSFDAYMNKTGGYETPVDMPLKGYISKKEEEAQNLLDEEKLARESKQKWLVAIFTTVAINLVVLGSLLFFFRDRIPAYKFNDSLTLVNHNLSVQDSVVINNYNLVCLSGLWDSSSSLSISTPFGRELYKTKSLPSIRIALPLSTQDSLMEMSITTGGKTYSAGVMASPGYAYNLSVSGPMCPGFAKDTVYIRYSDAAQYDNIMILKRGLEKKGYYVAELLLSGLTKNNYVLYASPEDEMKAARLGNNVNGFITALPGKELQFVLSPNDEFFVNHKNRFLVTIHDIVLLKSLTVPTPTQVIVPKKDTVLISYCQGNYNGKIKEFAGYLRQSGIYYPLVSYRESTCENKLKYYSLLRTASVVKLSELAYEFFKMRITPQVSLNRPVQNKNGYTELSILFSDYILWVDDHPENNAEDVEFLRKNGFEIDLAYDNPEALKRLNSKTYGFVISDINRDKPMNLAKDAGTGIDFVKAVNFPKQNLVIFSGENFKGEYADELTSAGVTNSLWGHEALRTFLLKNRNIANTRFYSQDLKEEASNTAQNTKTKQKPELDLIIKYEGFREKPTEFFEGKSWIGVGHVLTPEERKKGYLIIRQEPVYYEKGISRQNGEDLLDQDLDYFRKAIDDMVRVELNNNQHAALLSLVYNIGVMNLRNSKLIELINQNELQQASKEFLKWSKINNKESPGLLSRRQAEITLWETRD